jgi:hypothetical protein
MESSSKRGEARLLITELQGWVDQIASHLPARFMGGSWSSGAQLILDFKENNGAGDGVRTHDLLLGKQAF